MKFLERLDFNWFDAVVLALLVIGLFRGRKHGMSEELLLLLQVLSMVVISAYYYAPVARLYARYTASPMLISNIVGYLFFVLLIKVFFTFILQRAATERIVSIDLFGKMEYYFGMIAGAMRYAGFVVIALAVIHARGTPPPQTGKPVRTATEEALGELISPKFTTLHKEVFEDSFTGRVVKRHLNHMLITPVVRQQKSAVPTDNQHSARPGNSIPGTISARL